MTVLSASEKPLSRTGSVSGTEANEKRIFLVKADTPYESAYTMAPFLPTYLSAHPQNPYTFVRNFDYGQPDAKNDYEVTVNYSSLPISQAEREKGVLNPLDRKAKTRWDKRKEMIPMDRDVHGNPIVNAALEYFDPPPEKTETIWMLRFEKNVASRPTWLATYEDSINNADLVIPDVFTVPKGCAKLVIDDLGDPMEENGFEFFVLKFTLEFRKRPDPTNCYSGVDATAITPDGWSLVALNQGLKELYNDGGSFVLLNMTDDQGDTLTAPYPLDINGAKITGDTAAERRDAIIWLVWDQYESKDLSVLPMA